MFIEQGYKGLSDGWRYALGLFSVFIVWQIFGGMPLLIAIFVKAESFSNLPTDMGGMASLLGSNLFFFLMLLAFVIGIVCLYVYVKYVHKQTWTELTTSREKIDWKRVFFAFVLWATISAFLIVLGVNLAPEDYEFNFNLQPFLILAVIAVVLVPIQCAMEEYYMRGYMMQGIGIVAKNRWVPLVVTSTLFGLMHILNPEVAKMGYITMVYYIGTGFFLGILTLMDEGLELPIGFHAANNLVGALLMTSDWSVFQTHSVYKEIAEPTVGWEMFFPVLVVYPILLFVFSKKYGWTNWKEKLTGKVLSKEEFIAEQTEDGLAL